MTSELPEHYFRITRNGARVYRAESDPRTHRLSFVQIARINMNHEKVTEQNEDTLTPSDWDAINAWIKNRKAELRVKKKVDFAKSLEEINLFINWVDSEATDKDIEEFADKFLYAIHDLRLTLAERKSKMGS